MTELSHCGLWVDECDSVVKEHPCGGVI